MLYSLYMYMHISCKPDKQSHHAAPHKVFVMCNMCGQRMGLIWINASIHSHAQLTDSDQVIDKVNPSDIALPR